MPITWRVGGGSIVEIVFSDPYTIADSEHAMKEIFARQSLPRPLRFLVDVRQSTPPDTEFVASAITFWQLHVGEMWDAKIAVVAANERQLGMAQMSERTVASRELPFTVRVFEQLELEKAEQWLERDRQ
jgi:SpoIIAA-like